jgi:hypothetical protein
VPEGGEYVDRRPEEDPIHAPLIQRFREEQGYAQSGVDADGHPSGPSAAQIKYGPRPIAIENGPFHAPIDTAGLVGMAIAITMRYSGNRADLSHVQDSEQVGLSFNHTGSFVGVAPIASSQSGFMSALAIPNDRHGADRATILAIAARGPGSFSKHQLDIYTHAREGVVTPIVVMNSGYQIDRTISTGPGTQVALTTAKRPVACTVNGFSTAPGPSPAQSERVIVRP